MKETDYLTKIPDRNMTDLAKVVSLGTSVGKMLPKSYEQVLDLFEKRHSVVAYNNEEPIGHAALTFEWPDNWFEVGALYTDEEYQRKGIGGGTVLNLLSYAKSKYPDGKFFALANELSGGLFKGIGATVMSPVDLPKSVWEACDSCPVKPKTSEREVFMCCDTPYNLTEVKGYNNPRNPVRVYDGLPRGYPRHLR